jgi:hypothetical protein
VIRYADDFVIGVAREDDARRIMDVLPKRMSKYGLTVHPEKTRLVRFEPPEIASTRRSRTSMRSCVRAASTPMRSRPLRRPSCRSATRPGG